MEKRWQKTRGRVAIGRFAVGERAAIGLGEASKTPDRVCGRAGAASRSGTVAGSGGEGGGVSSPVAVQGEAVDHERVAEQVEELAVVADGVGAAEPEGVVEVAVDALGVVAARVEPGEVRIGRRDDADVLGPVQVAVRVVGGAVKADRHDAPAKTVGEAVVVVPAVPAGLVGVSVRADPGELGVEEIAAFGQLADPDRTTSGGGWLMLWSPRWEVTVRGMPDPQLAMLTTLQPGDLIPADHPIRRIRWWSTRSSRSSTTSSTFTRQDLVGLRALLAGRRTRDTHPSRDFEPDAVQP